MIAPEGPEHATPRTPGASRLHAPQMARVRALERVMNLGENGIVMRIPRLAWFLRDLRFPHSYAVSNRVHNTL